MHIYILSETTENCFYAFVIQVRFWRLDLEKDFPHKCQDPFYIALSLHADFIWDFWMGNSFNFICCFFGFFFHWNRREHSGYSLLFIGCFAHCSPVQRCRIWTFIIFIKDFLTPVFQLSVTLFQRTPYWTLHGLGYYWKWTKHHSLFLCCLVFSWSLWGEKK